MQNIHKPTLIVDTNVCKQNIDNMLNKAKSSKINLRPHFKTHQNAIIGNLFKNAGVQCITVSSIDMALEFAAQGWHDITIAFPANILQIDEIDHLAKNISLTLVVENHEAIEFLNQHLHNKVFVQLKIDVGYNRTGIYYQQTQLINDLLNAINSSMHLEFSGFLSHFGNTYNAKTTAEIEEIYKTSMKRLLSLQMKYPNAKISIGDTPSCSIINDFSGANEIRPGNFVYYDAFQMNLGVCSIEQIAVQMACPIVAIHKERNEVVIHGGAVHFSKDNMAIKSVGQVFGLVAKTKNSKLKLTEGAYLKKISQEHGIVSGSKEWIDERKVGELLYIIPIHSCLTANLMKENTVFI